jgi:hypothetical protein
MKGTSMKRLLVGMCGASVLHVAVAIAQGQQTYTFDGNGSSSGVWSLPQNWAPETGPPQAGDTAIIPDTFTCLVQGADAAAKVVSVQSGGKLIIDGKTLTIAYSSSAASLTVDGELEFRTVSSVPGTLAYNNDDGNSGTNDIFVIAGSGTVKATGASGHQGALQAASATGLKIDSDVTLRGSLNVGAGKDIITDGTFIVDDSSDTMVFAGGTANRWFGTYDSVADTGRFQVSAGAMAIPYAYMPEANMSCKFEVSGGALTFVGAAFESFNMDCTARFEISGGQVTFRRAWLSRGGFDY